MKTNTKSVAKLQEALEIYKKQRFADGATIDDVAEEIEDIVGYKCEEWYKIADVLKWIS